MEGKGVGKREAAISDGITTLAWYEVLHARTRKREKSVFYPEGKLASLIWEGRALMELGHR